MEEVFKPFAQTDASTTRKYGGTGLGLTICARLVSMLGGNIWAESELGRGSQFHFTARLESVRSKSEPEAAVPYERLRGKRVLVVDDNATNRRILQEMLKRWEMLATSAASGEEAMAELLSAHVAGQPYQLILTDMHMPKLDGFGLIARIRSKTELSTTAIMMLTSAGHREDVQRCKELGVASYLMKPVRKSELLLAVGKALGESERAPQPDAAVQPSPALPDNRLRVLLAEDNRVNQMVAVRTMEKMGHSVIVADNGLEALSLLAQQTFDLVLMDVQMPQLDGLAATRKIREGAVPGCSAIPIIAMTALAMKGDRERCLDAGMSGYVSKPVSRKELEDAIAAQFNTPSHSAPVSDVPMGRTTLPNNFLSWNSDRLLQSLGGDQTFLNELLAVFLDETPKKLQIIKEALSGADSSTVERTAHSLKGELLYLGISELTKNAGDLEQFGRVEDLQRAADSFATLEAGLSALIQSIQHTNSRKTESALAAKKGAGG
jgi:CheY-like chemotaxis protein